MLWEPGSNVIGTQVESWLWQILSPPWTSVLATYTYSLLGEEGGMRIFPDNDFPEVQQLTGGGIALLDWAKSLIKVRYINGDFI